ncbi:hypothetical protein BRD03_02930 [Halobacteriales archaeon QS_9_68_17]|nr:MAG: hypothetical protein BRD03_02930 [Halobacteriales archaeon QS_9_68_17]
MTDATAGGCDTAVCETMPITPRHDRFVRTSATRVRGPSRRSVPASRNAVPFYERHRDERVAERTREFGGGVEGTVVEFRKDLSAGD